MGTESRRLTRAYPVLLRGTEHTVELLRSYLSTFGNLHLTGRSGRFAYIWIHDLVRAGRDIIEAISARRMEH